MTLSLLLVAVSCYINQTQLKPDGIGCSQADAVLHAIEVEFPNCDFSIVCLAILAQVQLQATAQLAALYTASFRTYRLQMSQTATSMGLHRLEEYVSCCLPKLPVVRLCSVQPNQPGSESDLQYTSLEFLLVQDGSRWNKHVQTMLLHLALQLSLCGSRSHITRESAWWVWLSTQKCGHLHISKPDT